MPARRLIASILAYTLYALVVFGGILYITFPYQILQDRINETLLQRGWRVSMARPHPAFPPGLSVHEVRLYLDTSDANTPVLQMQALRLRPDWGDLVSGKFRARFDATLYNGQVNGKVGYLAGERRWLLDTQIANVDIARYPLIQRQNKPLLTGKAHGTATVALHHAGTLGDSVVKGQMQPLVVTGKHDMLPLQQDITCDTAEVELKFVPGQPNPVSFKCQGNDLLIETNGTIGWQSPLQASEVNLRWRIHSEAAYKQEITLLSGLIGRPPDRRGDLTFRMQGLLRKPRYGA